MRDYLIVSRPADRPDTIRLIDHADEFRRSSGYRIMVSTDTDTVYRFPDSPTAMPDGQLYRRTTNDDGDALYLLSNMPGSVGPVASLVVCREDSQALWDNYAAPLTGFAEYMPGDRVSVSVFAAEIADYAVWEHSLPVPADATLLTIRPLLTTAGFLLTGPWADQRDGAEFSYRAPIAVSAELPPYDPFPRS